MTVLRFVFYFFLCMWVHCVNVHIGGCMYVWIFTMVDACVCACSHWWVHVCVFVHTGGCICGCMCVHVYICGCMCAHMFTLVGACVCACSHWGCVMRADAPECLQLMLVNFFYHVPLPLLKEHSLKEIQSILPRKTRSTGKPPHLNNISCGFNVSKC